MSVDVCVTIFEPLFLCVLGFFSQCYPEIAAKSNLEREGFGLWFKRACGVEGLEVGL